MADRTDRPRRPASRAQASAGRDVGASATSPPRESGQSNAAESATPRRRKRTPRGDRIPIEQAHERAIALARFGNHRDVIAAAIGWGLHDLERWLRTPRYGTFRQAFEAAESEAESRNVNIIAAAARDNWQAAAWLLERRWPERWARASQRDKGKTSGDTRPGDPFAEVDELATRRRNA